MTFLKKNWYLVIPAALLGAPLLMALYISVSYDYTFGESVECLKAMGKERTKFAPFGYSESEFKRIAPGMSGRDVFELVNKPIERHDNDTVWLYSVPVDNAPFYHERTVLMDKGKVTGTIKRFHTPETK